MKKKILSFLLCLCMVAVLLPTTALAAPVEKVTFGYAYDAQRLPAFPTTGQTVTMSYLDNPVISGDIGNDQRGENSGSWTLTRVGTYSYVKDNLNSSYLNSIVNSVANAYGISDKKDTIVIHELKNGDDHDDHIAYGVVLAYSETENRAVFVGDLWNDSGACYLLSQNKINYDSDTTVTMRAEMVATDFVEQTPLPSTPVVIIVPDDTTNTADPAKNPETGDNSTHLLWAVMASSALCAAALLFSSRRRGEEMQ